MKRPRSSRSRKRKTFDWRRLSGWAVKLGLVALVALAGVCIYLDAVVQEKFSGKRWTIPAKVYARPLELFNGVKLSRDDFLTELDALGYRREKTVDGPGSVSVGASTVELNTRASSSTKASNRPGRSACASPAAPSPASAPWMAATWPWPAWNR